MNNATKMINIKLDECERIIEYYVFEGKNQKFIFGPIDSKYTIYLNCNENKKIVKYSFIDEYNRTIEHELIYENKKLIKECFYVNHMLHNMFGPAKIVYYQSKPFETYYIYGIKMDKSNYEDQIQYLKTINSKNFPKFKSIGKLKYFYNAILDIGNKNVAKKIYEYMEKIKAINALSGGK